MTPTEVARGSNGSVSAEVLAHIRDGQRRLAYLEGKDPDEMPTELMPEHAQQVQQAALDNLVANGPFTTAGGSLTLSKHDGQIYVRYAQDSRSGEYALTPELMSKIQSMAHLDFTNPSTSLPVDAAHFVSMLPKGDAFKEAIRQVYMEDAMGNNPSIALEAYKILRIIDGEAMPGDEAAVETISTK